MADNHSILVGTLGKSPLKKSILHSKPTIVMIIAGMFILDSFKYTCDYSSTHIPALVPGEWYIGGGGTYATVGARMWLPPERIAMVIHPGHDFPRKITDQLEGYSRTLFTFLSDPTHPETTRALNTYTNERREFEYLTTKRQVRLDELYSAKSVPPRYVHVICSPMRLLQIMQEREARFPGWQVQWIWEPVPESCTPSNLSKVQECVNKSMVVFSPNDLEASELLGRPSAPSSAEAIEAIADHFHCMGFPAVVIRSGKRGAFVIGAPLGSQSLQRFWVPPLIQDQSLVVDQTGAGNAFLVASPLS
ncbi:hypothetical protein VP01_2024g4 [Puccinia sorghi]|uniref:Carbohydrate kinase PfkB domain-containing protein n=1 Tax=Puccinia sorghi TaxID=27349 RepID=A0A0L6VB59_9BASI|nr:hypothetical protein VP01_2024g4 [Puccinia sorghi]